MQYVTLRIARVQLGVGTLVLPLSGQLPQIWHRSVDDITVRVDAKTSSFVKEASASLFFRNDFSATGGSCL